MKIPVFDDWKSITHFFLGMASTIAFWIIPVYLVYEVLECIILERDWRPFLGDLIEFALGYVVAFLLQQIWKLYYVISLENLIYPL